MRVYKKCSSCKRVLPIKKFGKNKVKWDGLDNECRSCRKDSARKSYLKNKSTILEHLAELRDRYRERNDTKDPHIKGIVKRCPCCGRELPVFMFFRNRCSYDGLSGWCKECRQQEWKAYFWKNREKLSEDAERYRLAQKERYGCGGGQIQTEMRHIEAFKKASQKAKVVDRYD